jgi:hypothetical protein
MRKIRLLVVATLVAVGANAQYFQHVYGSTNRDLLESGVNTNAASPQGHIMTGYTDVTGINNIMLTRTDLDGRFAFAPVFNNRYAVFENAIPRDAKARRVIHPLSLGGRIAVWGDLAPAAGAISTRFFYALYNPVGAPIFIFAYQLPFPIVEAEATSMSMSTSNPNDVFMCGWVRIVAGGQRYPVIMSLNAGSGIINWAQVYVLGNTDWIATDLVESPYPTPTGVPEIALVGRMTAPGAFETGCFFRVTVGGVLVPLLVEYGTPTSNPGGFDAIDIANNPVGSGPGFVFGGYYNNPLSGNDDSWAMKTDPTGLIVDFSTVIDYSIPGNNDYGHDIIERQNTLAPPNDYEYFLGGYVMNGFFGGDDDVVYKLDFNGIPVGGGQFTFGGPGDERAMQLDQYNGYGANNDGLSTFGRTIGSWALLGNNDFYFVKSYFNGVTACNYDLQNPPSVTGPGVVLTYDPRVLDRLNRRNLTMVMNAMSDWEICWAPNDPFGNNARLAQSAIADQLSHPGYFPNPVSHDNAIVTVAFGKEAVEGVAVMELWNSLGQLCWTKQAPVAKGQTNMQVELGNELTGGMYHLIIRQPGVLNNYRILVQ